MNHAALPFPCEACHRRCLELAESSSGIELRHLWCEHNATLIVYHVHDSVDELAIQRRDELRKRERVRCIA